MNFIIPMQNYPLEAKADAESFLIKDRLWWVRGRKTIIRKYLERARRYGAISTIMDIGCGSVKYLNVLGNFGRVIVVEPSKAMVRKRKCQNINSLKGKKR
jgi:hypothetical protein